MKYTSVFIIIQMMAFIKMDNLVLLSGTLRQFEQNGCDDDQMTLKCPSGTSISVELAQYGKTSANNRCPSKSSDVKNASCSGSSIIQNKWEEMTKGTWGRYSLLQTVVEACQKKKSCKFQASPRSLDGDLCSGERKYIEVAYKCRPYEFRSRVACENERVQLQCNPNSRVAIYSASYGRTEYESFQCPQPQGVAEETCLVSYATERVMKICHGKRSCEFGADSTTFGSPCRPQTKMYLRIVYTCVPQKVLSAEYEEPLKEDETEQDFTFDPEDLDGIESTKERIREFAASPDPKSPNLKQVYKQNDSIINESPYSINSTNGRSPSQEFINIEANAAAIARNTYIYVILSIGATFLLCIIVITSRALARRHHDAPIAKYQANPNPIEGETELESNTSLPMHHNHYGFHSHVQDQLESVHCQSHVQDIQEASRAHSMDYFYG